jgi:hypothetical protein
MRTFGHGRAERDVSLAVRLEVSGFVSKFFQQEQVMKELQTITGSITGGAI